MINYGSIKVLSPSQSVRSIGVLVGEGEVEVLEGGAEGDGGVRLLLTRLLHLTPVHAAGDV